MDSAVCHHLLNCNYSSFFEDSSVLCHKSKKKRLELKESLILRDRQPINQIMRSTPVYLSERVLIALLAALYAIF